MRLKLTKAQRAFFQATGKKGGEARAKKLSPERRSEIAKFASKCHWTRRAAARRTA